MTDDELLAAFEDCSLPSDLWNHRAHLRVAFLYATRHDLESATHRMRVGLKAYNQATGVPDEPGRGYHETITIAFMQLIREATRGQARSFDEFTNIWPQFFDKRVLLRFYSRDRIGSAEAKQRFVAPDLQPLSLAALVPTET